MSADLVLMAVLAGLANWAFRVLPTLLLRSDPKPGGLLAGFLSSTGPAAIATLFVASVMGMIGPSTKEMVPLAAGSLATVFAFLPRRSVVVATLAGSFVYGLAFALLG